MNIAEALETGADRLNTAKIENPRRDAQLLLSIAIDGDAAFLIAHPEYELIVNEEQKFIAYLDRRSKREPLQYIVGKQEFYGLEFEVTADVLIPRPETEVLVEAAIKNYSGKEEFRFLEIGVGSGCISVAILKNLERAIATGTDISNAALKIASSNAEKHQVSERFSLIRSDLFSTLDESGFDLIVSNPPYIPDLDIDGLEPEVRNFEPRTALAGGSDGLDIVRSIVEDSPGFLKPGGSLLMEIGWDQAAVVEGSFDLSIWKNINFLKDLQGIERIVAAELK